MDFLGIGMGEVTLILLVALIIWGPGRVVEIGRTLGKAVRIFRKATLDLTTQITKELELEEKDRSIEPKEDSRRNTRKSSNASNEKPTQ